MRYQKELDVALEAARLAGQVILDIYQHFVAIPDAPSSISTEADHQAQEVILRHLLSCFPGDAYRAEERTRALEGTPDRGPRLWVVDPIDGTRGFARKNGEFSVMVGFVNEGQIGVGVVLEPVKARVTYAVQGGGCWKRDDAGPAERCRISSIRPMSEATLTQSHSRHPTVPNPYVRVLKPRRVVETYSAGVKLALVARGEVEIYLNDYNALRDWDLCAGHILVTEAGGMVTSLYGQVLEYGLPEGLHPNGVLAANEELHREVLQKLSEPRERKG
jgi:3'(2'), 5'-bisphosphate nucleotidase